VLRIAVPRRGRALPLLQLAYDRDALPAGKSQNQLEEEALLAVARVLPLGVRPVVLADRGFARASFLTWLQEQGLDYVVRITAGTGLVRADGSRWRLSTEGLQPGEIRWEPDVRYGQRYQGRPRDLRINVALCWRLPRHVQRSPRPPRADEPWYLATNQPSAHQAVAWYRQRFWIEIVCSQMTKTHVLAGGRRRDHVADLDIAVRDDHAVDEQFDQLALLLEGGVRQTALEALTKGFDGLREPAQVPLPLRICLLLV
jgi:hypothetical protein